VTQLNLLAGHHAPDSTFNGWISRGSADRAGPSPSGERVLFVAREAEALVDTTRLAARVGQLPKHVSGVEDWIWRCTLDLLRDPLAIWETKGGRLVVALGGYGYCLILNRLRDVAGEQVQGVKFARQMDDAAFAFRRRMMLEPLELAILDRASRAVGPAAGRSRRQVNEAIVRFHHILRNTGVMHELSCCVRKVVGVDEEALRLAARAWWPSHGRVLTNELYEFATANKRVLSQIAAETPTVFPMVLYAWEEGLLDGLDRGAIGALKKVMRERGVPSRVWRILADPRGRQIRTALRVAQAESPWEAVLSHCRWLNRCGAEQPVPEAMLRALNSCFEPDEDGCVPLGFRDPTDRQFIRLALAEYRRRPPEQRAAFIATEVLAVMDWVWSEMPCMDANQRRAGWPWALKAARLFEEWGGLTARCSAHRWSSPLARYERDGRVAVALDSAIDLREEGRALRHCIASYAGECAAGECLVYSVRDSSRRRLATVLLRSSGTPGVWGFETVRGFANSVTGDELEVFSRWILAAVNEVAAKRARTVDTCVKSRRRAHRPVASSDAVAARDLITAWLQEMELIVPQDPE
jgi:hypothetical protein